MSEKEELDNEQVITPTCKGAMKREKEKGQGNKD